MIYHIREEEKKKIVQLIEQVKGLENEVCSLDSFYSELSTKVEVQVINDQLLKLMKKGRLNITENKTIYSFKVLIGGHFEERISIYAEKDDKNEKTYLVSKFESSYFDEKCDSITYTKDNVEIFSMLNIVNRIMFKLSEIVARVAIVYETDTDTIRELEKVKDNLRWSDVFTNVETEKAIKDLDNLSVVLSNVKGDYDIDYKFNHDLIAEGFKKYRSNKDLVTIKYSVDNIDYTDSLKIVKDGSKYFYELRLTKFDKYKKLTDIVEVYDRKEVSIYGFERFIRDMVYVFIDTTTNRISELTK